MKIIFTGSVEAEPPVQMPAIYMRAPRASENLKSGGAFSSPRRRQAAQIFHRLCSIPACAVPPHTLPSPPAPPEPNSEARRLDHSPACIGAMPSRPCWTAASKLCHLAAPEPRLRALPSRSPASEPCRSAASKSRAGAPPSSEMRGALPSLLAPEPCPC